MTGTEDTLNTALHKSDNYLDGTVPSSFFSHSNPGCLRILTDSCVQKVLLPRQWCRHDLYRGLQRPLLCRQLAIAITVALRKGIYHQRKHSIYVSTSSSVAFFRQTRVCFEISSACNTLICRDAWHLNVVPVRKVEGKLWNANTWEATMRQAQLPFPQNSHCKPQARWLVQ